MSNQDYNPSQERIQIVDRNDVPLTSATRGEMRRQRLIHRAAYILVFNEAGCLFIQKRTMTKDIYPGYWDLAAGGIVLAEESYEDAAARELAEELGVTAGPFQHLFDQYFEDSSNRVWGRVFSCTHNGPFVLQKEEIEHGHFIPLSDIESLHEREPFTPDSMPLLKRIPALGNPKKMSNR
ncbi:NUDIX hydrolase YfcD [Desulfogranum marinum]|uniref:NUDIX hydrolase YfcD n=1 Tax=Desulfogranum marinum TaxID=453220 RepID=UPI002FCBC0EB